MRHVRLLIFLLLSGAVAAVVGGFLTAMTIALVELGPAGLLVGLPAAGLGILVAIRIAALPAMLVGALLWYSGVRRTSLWAGAGALAGLGLYAFLSAFPGFDSVTIFLVGPGTWWLAAVLALAAIPAALAFRLMMDSLTALDDPGEPERP